MQLHTAGFTGFTTGVVVGSTTGNGIITTTGDASSITGSGTGSDTVGGAISTTGPRECMGATPGVNGIMDDGTGNVTGGTTTGATTTGGIILPCAFASSGGSSNGAGTGVSIGSGKRTSISNELCIVTTNSNESTNGMSKNMYIVFDPPPTTTQLRYIDAPRCVSVIGEL